MSTTEQPKPEVIHRGALSMQVCVTADFPDEELLRFAESENPCGTTNGWAIRREGDPLLDGMRERTKCAGREGCVHIMLDA